MGEEANQLNANIVDTIWENSFKKYKDETNTNIGRVTRNSEEIKTDEILENQRPFFSSVFTSMFSHNNMEMMKMMELLIRKVVTEVNQGLISNTNNKLIDLAIENDRLDSINRLDNILVIGHIEPDKNYDQYGRETQDELENILINAANKVDIEIKREEISIAYRVGKRPILVDGQPKLRRGGDQFACPIFFKLNKRAKKAMILSEKKNLKDTHGIRIADDVSPMKKKLCDFTNRLESVKVAYPIEGKIFIRLKNNADKVIKIESAKDLIKAGLIDDNPDWRELGFVDIIT